jgi:hypothetical protein
MVPALPNSQASFQDERRQEAAKGREGGMWKGEERQAFSHFKLQLSS